MPDRGQPPRVDPNRRGRIYLGRNADGSRDETLTETPDPGFPETPDPRLPSANSQRLSNRAADRLLTTHPAEGAVEVDFSAALMPVGGKVIFCRRVAGVLYMDVAFGEGPIENPGGFFGLNWKGLTAAQVHCQYEFHYGEPGDTTSTLIQQTQFDYTAPEGVTRISMKFIRPDEVDFNPFDVTVQKKGVLLYDVTTTTTGNSGNPSLVAYRMLVDPVFSNGKDPAELLTAYFQLAQAQCDQFVDPAVDPEVAIKQWDVSIRFDQQDLLENQLQILLDHCFGHTVWDGGKLGIYLDVARLGVEDDDTTPLVFRDHDTDAANGIFNCNMAGEVSYQTRNRSQRPTVVIGEWTDASKKFADSTSQYPKPGDFDTSLPWIPLRVRRSGITTQERIDRHVKQLFLMMQLEKDILLPLWDIGYKVLPGDRVRVDSRILLGLAESNANAGAVAGQEDVVITDLQLEEELGVTARASLYRDETFALPVFDAPDPQPPTNLKLTEVRSTGPFGEVVWNLVLTWDPAITPYYRGTRVRHRVSAGAWIEDGEFVENIFSLGNPTPNALYEFELYTELLETSESTAATISTVTNLGTVPEVVRAIITGLGYLYFYGPVSVRTRRAKAPDFAPTLSTLAGGVVPDGTYVVAYSRVRDTGETQLSPAGTIVVGGGNNRIQIDGLIDEDDPNLLNGQTIFKKIYISETDALQPYYQSNEAFGSNSQTFNGVPNTALGLPPNLIAPEIVDHYELLDTFGAPPEPVVALTIPGWSPPHSSKMFDVRSMVHPDPAAPGYGRIDMLIRVVATGGARSAGLAASGAPIVLADTNAIINQGDNPAPPTLQANSSFVIDRVGQVGQLAILGNNQFTPAGLTTYDDVELNGVGQTIFIDDTLGTDPFEITGFINLGATPSYNIVIELLNVSNKAYTLKHNSAPTAANGLFLPFGLDLSVPTGFHTVVLIKYDTVVVRWILWAKNF